MADLNEYDIKLLRICNGEDVPEITGWGSWMTPCLEHLYGHKLVERVWDAGGYSYVTTNAGRAALAAKEEQT